jgi:hypothetical protein
MNRIETLCWIPVDERLPDSDLTVLLFSSAADEPVWLGHYDSDGKRWWYVDAMKAEPTYWAEIPEGPTP